MPRWMKLNNVTSILKDFPVSLLVLLEPPCPLSFSPLAEQSNQSLPSDNANDDVKLPSFVPATTQQLTVLPTLLQ